MPLQTLGKDTSIAGAGAVIFRSKKINNSIYNIFLRVRFPRISLFIVVERKTKSISNASVMQPKLWACIGPQHRWHMLARSQFSSFQAPQRALAKCHLQELSSEARFGHLDSTGADQIMHALTFAPSTNIPSLFKACLLNARCKSLSSSPSNRFLFKLFIRKIARVKHSLRLHLLLLPLERGQAILQALYRFAVARFHSNLDKAIQIKHAFEYFVLGTLANIPFPCAACNSNGSPDIISRKPARAIFQDILLK